jgi:hypothetical protein
MKAFTKNTTGNRSRAKRYRSVLETKRFGRRQPNSRHGNPKIGVGSERLGPASHYIAPIRLLYGIGPNMRVNVAHSRLRFRSRR